MKPGCRHQQTEEVKLFTGETVRLICADLDCDTVLPLDWDGSVVETRKWGQRPGEGVFAPI